MKQHPLSVAFLYRSDADREELKRAVNHVTFNVLQALLLDRGVKRSDKKGRTIEEYIKFYLEIGPSQAVLSNAKLLLRSLLDERVNVGLDLDSSIVRQVFGYIEQLIKERDNIDLLTLADINVDIENKFTKRRVR